jgi:chemotaxis protein CheD
MQGLTGIDTPRKVNIVQGEFFVTREADLVVSTLLGSCVAACIRDPFAAIGGINHYLLPGDDVSAASARSEGLHLMELLVNGLMKAGARRDRLEGKLFGGARAVQGLSDIGRQNIAFAEEFLRREGIGYIGGSVGGDRGRRILCWPAMGRVRQSFMAGSEAFSAPRRPVVMTTSTSGDVELF